MTASSVAHLKSLGFSVVVQDHVPGTDRILQNALIAASNNRTLHGMYFWGHGRASGGHWEPNSPGDSVQHWVDDWPAVALVSPQNNVAVMFNEMGGLQYKMALAVVWACDSNSGKSALFSGSPGSIWFGWSGLLDPVGHPFYPYFIGNQIHHGDQMTK